MGVLLRSQREISVIGALRRARGWGRGRLPIHERNLWRSLRWETPEWGSTMVERFRGCGRPALAVTAMVARCPGSDFYLKR